MSHPTLRFMLTLAITCTLLLSACSTSERLSEAPAIAISEASTVTSSGIEGLRQDIAWMRSLPSDAKFSTSAGPVSRDDALSGLTSQLETLLHPRTSPGRSLSLSPNSPSFDYISYGDVGGQTYVSPAGTDAQGFKYETTYAFTSCTQNSTTVAGVDPRGTLSDFETGAYIGSLFLYPQTAVRYVSERGTQGILTTRLVWVQVNTKHTCQVGDRDNWPYKPTEGHAVI